ncbi:hypothetical protein ABW19_dt0200225 [Dactylella cylindrospora]|nr:hypothetical protein ABW19_dt0200225 [Dactylella cylindrospora]
MVSCCFRGQLHACRVRDLIQERMKKHNKEKLFNPACARHAFKYFSLFIGSFSYDPRSDRVFPYDERSSTALHPAARNRTVSPRSTSASSAPCQIINGYGDNVQRGRILREDETRSTWRRSRSRDSEATITVICFDDKESLFNM